MTEARLHLFVVGTRQEIIESLVRLARGRKLKIGQGGLERDRRENREQALYDLLRGYAAKYGDVRPRENEDWGGVEVEFEALRKHLTFPKFQWIRPIGTLTLKARIAKLAPVLRETPIDPQGLVRLRKVLPGPVSFGSAFSSLSRLGRAAGDAAPAVPEELRRMAQSEFSLIKGDVRVRGAYILHVVGAPVDVDSDRFADLYTDDVPLLWDFGAAHTEIGALDPVDHLMSATTNFLLGPAILFQHFFLEGRTVAMVHKGARVKVLWARRRSVVHESDTIDMELGFRSKEVTVPTPIERGASIAHDLPSGGIVLFTLGSSQDPSGTGDWTAAGITHADLRAVGYERPDWNLLYSLARREFMIPSKPPKAVRPYPPVGSAAWLLKDWTLRTVRGMEKVLELPARDEPELMVKMASLDEASHAARARDGMGEFVLRAETVLGSNFDGGRYIEPLRRAAIFPILSSLLRMWKRSIGRADPEPPEGPKARPWWDARSLLGETVEQRAKPVVPTPNDGEDIPEAVRRDLDFDDTRVDDVRALVTGLESREFPPPRVHQSDQAINALAAVALGEAQSMTALIDRFADDLRTSFRSVAAAVPAAGLEETRRRRLPARLEILLGGLVMVLGGLIVALPRLGVAIQIILLGFGLISAGASKVVTGVRARDIPWGLRALGLAIGSAAVLVGILAVLGTGIGRALILIFLAVALGLYGLSRLGDARDRAVAAAWRAVYVAVGLVCIVMSGIVLAFPVLGFELLVVLLALTLVATGAGSVLSGWSRLRGPRKRSRTLEPMPASGR